MEFSTLLKSEEFAINPNTRNKNITENNFENIDLEEKSLTISDLLKNLKANAEFLYSHKPDLIKEISHLYDFCFFQENSEDLEPLLIAILFLQNCLEYKLVRDFGIYFKKAFLINFGMRSFTIPSEFFEKIDKNITKNQIIVKKILIFFSKNYEEDDILNNHSYNKIAKEILHKLSYSIDTICAPELLNTLISKKNYYLLDILLLHYKKISIIPNSKKKEYKLLICKKFCKKIAIDFNLNEYKIIFEKALRICIEKKLQKISTLLIRFSKGFFINKEILLLAIEKKMFCVLKKYIKYYFNHSQEIFQKEIFKKLLYLLGNQETFLDAINIIFLLRKSNIEITQIQAILERFENLNENEEVEVENVYNYIILSKENILPKSIISYILTSVNPTLTTVIISYLFYNLSIKKNNNNSVKIYNIALKYRELALNIFNSFDDSLIIKNILTKNFYPLPKNLTMLDILFEFKDFFLPFLIKNTVAEVVTIKWASSYKWDFNIFCSSTSYNYLIGKKQLEIVSNKINFLNTRKKEKSMDLKIENLFQKNEKYSKNIFKLISNENNNCIKENNHIYQFIVLYRSISYLNFLEFIIYLIVFCFTYFYLIKFLLVCNNVIDLSDETINLITRVYQPGNIKVNENLAGFLDYSCNKILLFYGKNTVSDYKLFIDCKTLLEATIYYHNNQENLRISFVSLLILGSGGIFKGIYYNLNYNIFKIFSNNIFDIITMVLSFVYLLIEYNFKNSGSVAEKIKQFLLIVKIIGPIIIFFQWLKFIFYMRLAKRLGILIKIIELMLIDILYFLFILFLSLMAFGTIFFLLFNSQIEQFSTIWLSLRELASSTLGGFKFYTNNGLYSILLIIFLIFSNVMLLNLLIAILSNTYSKIMEKSNMQYAQIIYDTYIQYKPNKYYSAMIFLPFIGINYLMIPILVLAKSAKVNLFLIKIWHLIMLIFYFFIYQIVAIIILIPFAYLKIIFSILLNKYFSNDTGKVNILLFCRIQHLVFWVFGGLIYLFYIHFFYDSYYFIISSVEHVNNKEKIGAISIYDYKILKKTIRFFIKNSNENENTMKIEESVFERKFFEFYQEFIDNIKIYQKPVRNLLIKDEISYIKKESMCIDLDLIFVKEKIDWKGVEIEIPEANNYLKKICANGIFDCKLLNLLLANLQKMKKKIIFRKKNPQYLQIYHLKNSYSLIESFIENYYK